MVEDMATPMYIMCFKKHAARITFQPYGDMTSILSFFGWPLTLHVLLAPSHPLQVHHEIIPCLVGVTITTNLYVINMFPNDLVLTTISIHFPFLLSSLFKIQKHGDHFPRSMFCPRSPGKPSDSSHACSVRKARLRVVTKGHTVMIFRRLCECVAKKPDVNWILDRLLGIPTTYRSLHEST